MQSSIIRHSPEESRRFGFRVGRCMDLDGSVQAESDLEGIEKYDVVILRRPVQNLDRLKLLKGNRYVAFHADTLIYWTWIDDGRELLCEDVSIKRSSDLYKLELLVRDVFESYENHYFSNPVFQTDLVLSGYVEWAQRNCSTVGSYILLSEPSDEEVGFATVAWNEDVPNVELAGIRSNMRGKGHYRNLMLAIMQETRIAEKSSVQISTQVTHLIVQRAWASLGWKPTEVQETIHLVRGDLVRGVWS